jgi:GntR family transcriptional regulator, histidine utilization repressor
MSDLSRTGYREVKGEILARIRSREWPAGHAIPGEVELAESFGVARGTVSRAMQELMEEGVIERRRKAGTRVAQSPVRQARLEIPLVRAEIEATGAVYRYRLLSREITSAPDWLSAQLSVSSDTQMVHLRCLHMADSQPYQFEDRWISLDAVPAARAEPFTEANPNEWLVQAVPFTDAEFAFRAAAAERETAALLGIRESEPVFIADRTTWLGGKPVTFARMHFRNSYRMVTRI